MKIISREARRMRETLREFLCDVGRVVAWVIRVSVFTFIGSLIGITLLAVAAKLMPGFNLEMFGIVAVFISLLFAMAYASGPTYRNRRGPEMRRE